MRRRPFHPRQRRALSLIHIWQTDLVARSEAARVARRELEEAKVKEIPLNQQIEIRKTLEAKLSASTGGKSPAKEKSDKNQLPAEKKGCLLYTSRCV